MMRVAVIYFSGQKPERLAALARAVARGIEKQGNQVDTIDGVRDGGARLTGYQYIAVGAEPLGTFGGRIPDAARTFLANAGAVAGKKSCAFVPAVPFGAQKALAALMKSMEGEGMVIKTSNVLRGPAEAEEIGARLHIG
jgi:hypothetical protein